MWVKGEIFRDFADAEGSAKGSLDRANQSSLFNRLDWFQRTWAHCRPGDRPLIVRARAEGSDVWLFLAQSNNAARGLSSLYTLAFRPVFSGTPSATTARALMIAVARRLRRRLGYIRLDHVPESEAELLCNAFTGAGWIARAAPQIANWSVDVTDTNFKDFWAGCSSELRSAAKRIAAKNLLEIAIFDRFDDGAWANYESIYADGWTPGEGPLSFVRSMAEDEGAAGALRLGIATLQGRAVAAQLWTVDHRIAIIHSLARRDDVAELSPDTILSKAMLEYVIDGDHVTIINFGIGDDAYKPDWMETRVMRMRVDLYNPRTVAGLIGAAKSSLRALAARAVNR